MSSLFLLSRKSLIKKPLILASLFVYFSNSASSKKDFGWNKTGELEVVF
jgi:hypothetical protein